MRHSLVSLALLICILARVAASEPPQDHSRFVMQAERLFSDRLFSNAIPTYSELISSTADSDSKAFFTLRLATCHVQEGDPLVAYRLLEEVSVSDQEGKSVSSLLIGEALHKMGNDSDALKAIEAISPSSDENPLLALERGILLIKLGQESLAKGSLRKIAWTPENPLPFYHARLLLAEMEYREGRFNSAIDEIDNLVSLLPEKHVLSQVSHYLKGSALFALHKNSEARSCFEALQPLATSTQSLLGKEVLKGLLISDLRQLCAPSLTKEEATILLKRAEEVVTAIEKSRDSDAEKSLLADFYLLKGRILEDEKAKSAAERLLQELETLPNYQLKSIEVLSSYKERDSAYSLLLKEAATDPSFCEKIYFCKGVNDLTEGLRQEEKGEMSEAASRFADAAEAFTRSGASKRSLIYRAFASVRLPQHSGDELAWNALNEINIKFSPISSNEKLEVDSLMAWVALRSKNPVYLKQAKEVLQSDLNREERKEIDLTIGRLALELGQWDEADACFSRIIDKAKDKSEALFWKGVAAEGRSELAQKVECFQRVYTEHPKSPFAPIAYFYIYSPQEYMQGSRKAIKHLFGMSAVFKEHPLLIYSHYLIGLYYLQDRSGKADVVRHRDLTAAIDSFQAAETCFERLYHSHALSSIELPYYTKLYATIQLQRGKANLAIAQHSEGGKRKIYLDYATSLFRQLSNSFAEKTSFIRTYLMSADQPYPPLFAEAELEKAKAEIEGGDSKQAEQTIECSLAHYASAGITRGPGLMRVFEMKGKLAKEKNDTALALHCFIEAEKAAKDETGVSPSEKLDLWIEQSLCYTADGDYDAALLTLSKVINADVISPLRVKAMYLRAENLELQGRFELAIKQLDATAKKGGPFAAKAKNKLEQKYGIISHDRGHL